MTVKPAPSGVPTEDLAQFFHERSLGTLIPRMVPILRASLVEKEMLDRMRRQARAAMQTRQLTSANPQDF